MLMKYHAPIPPGQRLLHTAGAIAGFLWSHTRELCKAIKHRRDMAVLANQDDRLLADIGLTRSDVHQAIRQPLWHDPTEVLRRRASAAHSGYLKCAVAHWQSADERNRRALAKLDDSQLSNLSDLGRRVRYDTRQRASA